MSNVAWFTVYQINQTVFPQGQAVRIGFPTSGCLLEDITNSPTRSLSSNYNVYGAITWPATNTPASQSGNIYYVQENGSQLATIFG